MKKEAETKRTAGGGEIIKKSASSSFLPIVGPEWSSAGNFFANI